MNADSITMIVSSWLVPSLVSGFAAFILGMIWYHPKVLGAKWAQARGVDSTAPAFASSQFIVTFPLWLLTSLFYTFMVVYFHVDTPTEIFLLACLLWVAFAMPPIVMGSLYTGHPFNAVAIDAAYQLAGYYTIGVVQALFHFGKI